LVFISIKLFIHTFTINLQVVQLSQTNHTTFDICFDLRWHSELYRQEQFLMEVGIEFHVAGER